MRALAILLSMVVLAPGPAVAQTVDRSDSANAVDSDRPAAEELDRLKAVTLDEIDRRLVVLDRLTQAVETAERLTAAHHDALLIQLSSARSRLTDLRAEVDGADSLRVLGALVPRIVTDYWVFALIVPQVHEVIAADTLVAVAADLQAVQNQIGSAVDRAASAGVDVSAASAALVQARTSAAEARALAVEVPGAVLPITSDEMPEAGDSLVGAARTLGVAFEHLKESASATRTAVTALRDAVTQADT